MLQFTLYMEANTCIESGWAWSRELLRRAWEKRWFRTNLHHLRSKYL